VVLVGDERQLGAVEAGKSFEQLRRAGVKTAVMDEILRPARQGSQGGCPCGSGGRGRDRFREARGPDRVG